MVKHRRTFNSELPNWVPFIIEFWLLCLGNAFSLPCYVLSSPSPTLISALGACPIWHMDGIMEPAFWLGFGAIAGSPTWDQRQGVGWQHGLTPLAPPCKMVLAGSVPHNSSQDGPLHMTLTLHIMGTSPFPIQQVDGGAMHESTNVANPGFLHHPLRLCSAAHTFVITPMSPPWMLPFCHDTCFFIGVLSVALVEADMYSDALMPEGVICLVSQRQGQEGVSGEVC